MNKRCGFSFVRLSSFFSLARSFSLAFSFGWRCCCARLSHIYGRVYFCANLMSVRRAPRLFLESAADLLLLFIHFSWIIAALLLLSQTTCYERITCLARFFMRSGWCCCFLSRVCFEPVAMYRRLDIIATIDVLISTQFCSYNEKKSERK